MGMQHTRDARRNRSHVGAAQPKPTGEALASLDPSSARDKQQDNKMMNGC